MQPVASKDDEAPPLQDKIVDVVNAPRSESVPINVDRSFRKIKNGIFYLEAELQACSIPFADGLGITELKRILKKNLSKDEKKRFAPASQAVLRGIDAGDVSKLN